MSNVFAGQPEIDTLSHTYQIHRYLAGTDYLRNARNLSDCRKAAYLRTLTGITGVTAKEAVDYLYSFNNKPQSWQRIQREIAAICDMPAVKEK
jgi:hypothetical protein